MKDSYLKNLFVNITLNRRKLNDCSAGYCRLAECEIKTRGSSERKLKIENWNKGKHLCICLTRIIKNAKAQIMHRKYLICCTTLYKYLETNISNYSNYFDNYSNVVKAFRLSTAFSSIYGFLLYVNDCMPVYWTICSWFVPTIWACAHRSSSPRVWLKRISSEQLRRMSDRYFY